MALGRQFRQQRLFNPLGMKKQPHQMTPMEFAASPRTWWHASDHEDFEDIRASTGYGGDFDQQGFHVGTLGAAEERMHGRGVSGSRGFFHPVRLNESGMHNSKDNPYRDQADDWTEDHHGLFYTNDFEDKGSVSAIVEDAHDVTHYADFVHEALGRGGIPSGAAEHFATRLDPPSGENEYTPGFPRKQYEAHRETVYSDEHPGYMAIQQPPRQLRPRPDAHDSPSQQVGRMFRDKYVQPPMIRQVETYNDQGLITGKGEAPHPAAVPAENLDAFNADEDRRRAPWLARVERGEL